MNYVGGQVRYILYINNKLESLIKRLFFLQLQLVSSETSIWTSI